jgi:hypothetical protein
MISMMFIYPSGTHPFGMNKGPINRPARGILRENPPLLDTSITGKLVTSTGLYDLNGVSLYVRNSSFWWEQDRPATTLGI